ncbi:hypothetical protein RJT34_04271 [Clitoria ternatea]|uniref:SCP domain-containing protein n=1 Tax=Clitoria ternatea TaxID=43366 RepID=A0AAN9Q396_CLITE
MCYITLAQNSPDDYLNAHNEARAEVGVGPLKWNNTLAAYALKYANLVVKNNCDNFEHSGGPYGECLALGEKLSGTHAINLWLAEKPNYDPNSNKCVNGECLHYTQVVWRNSLDLGCARVKCPHDRVFFICNYSPIGNIEGSAMATLVLDGWRSSTIQWMEKLTVLVGGLWWLSQGMVVSVFASS